MSPPEIGFIFALPQEAGSVLDRFEQRQTTRGGGAVFHTGKFSGLSAAAAVSGVGQHLAEKSAALLIDIFAPKMICSAGYAAGLSLRLKKFSICVPERTMRYSDRQILDLTSGIPRQTPPEERKLTLLTVNEVIESPEQKRMLGNETGAELLDMETFAVADCCRARKTPFLAVRVILDTVSEPIAKDVGKIAQSMGKGMLFSAGTIASAVLSRPLVIFDMFSLQKNAFTASEKLAKFLTKELRKELCVKQTSNLLPHSPAAEYNDGT